MKAHLREPAELERVTKDNVDELAAWAGGNRSVFYGGSVALLPATDGGGDYAVHADREVSSE